MHDLVIIGGGPAGLSAALGAARNGLDYIVLERSNIADTIYQFPTAKALFSTGNELELVPRTFPQGSKPTREALLSHYLKTARHQELRISTGVDVRQIIAESDSFMVHSPGCEFQSRAVLVATGGFGKQRMLSVAGESDDR